MPPAPVQFDPVRATHAVGLCVESAVIDVACGIASAVTDALVRPVVGTVTIALEATVWELLTVYVGPVPPVIVVPAVTRPPVSARVFPIFIVPVTIPLLYLSKMF